MTEKQTKEAVRELEKALARQFTEDEIENLEYHTDQSTKDTYTFRFIHPKHQCLVHLTYKFSNNSISAKITETPNLL